MRSRRKIWGVLIILAAVPFLTAGTPAAQGGGPMGGRRGPMTPDDRLKQMTKFLNLTDDQQAKIKPILVDEQKKMEDARNDANGDRESMRSKMIQIRQDSMTQIRTILDDKQKDLLDKQGDRMQNRRHGGTGAPGGPSGDHSEPPPPQNN